MDKLELKHLTPYLPYNLQLKLIQGHEGIKILSGIAKEGKDYFSPEEYCIKCRDLNYIFSIEDCKPILRPLSHLTEHITHNGKKFYPIDTLVYERDCDAEYDFLNALEDDWAAAHEKIQFAPYSIMIRLLEWHFDVFGLIEKGLAVPYENI